jgi:hypothetical protein
MSALALRATMGSNPVLVYYNREEEKEVLLPRPLVAKLQVSQV